MSWKDRWSWLEGKLPRLLWILAGLLLLAIIFVGLSEPFSRLIVVARWVVATLLDAIGLGHILLPIDTAEGDVRWEATDIRLSGWYRDRVEIVLASFRRGLVIAFGLVLFAGMLELAWRYREQLWPPDEDTAPAVSAKVGHGQASQPTTPIASPPAQLEDGSEKDEPVNQEEKAPAIDEVFGNGRFMMGSEEVLRRKPVVRHPWDYRPS